MPHSMWAHAFTLVATDRHLRILIQPHSVGGLCLDSRLLLSSQIELSSIIDALRSVYTYRQQIVALKS